MLKSCMECGHKVSTEARRCPNCGYKCNKTFIDDLMIVFGENKLGCLLLILIAVGLFFTFRWLIG